MTINLLLLSPLKASIYTASLEFNQTALFLHWFNLWFNNFKNTFSYFLSGEDCRKYSVNKTGPCLNGGSLICKPKTLPIHSTCLCPESFSGNYCENKIEPVGY